MFSEQASLTSIPDDGIVVVVFKDNSEVASRNINDSMDFPQYANVRVNFKGAHDWERVVGTGIETPDPPGISFQNGHFFQI